MSKIQKALRRIQKSGEVANLTSKATGEPEANVLPGNSIPLAKSKVVDVDGPKHHIDQTQLIHEGILAPLDQAMPVTDQFRRIKRPIIQNAFSGDQREMNSNLVMVASAVPGAGKTFCSVNLAASISLERELSVLLVDADINKPHITNALGLEDAPGLVDIIDRESRSLSEVLIRTDLNDLMFLPAGRKHSQSTELLASDRMARLMNELSTRYRDRIVIIDSPPLLITSEAEALAKQVGQIAFVVESGVTTQTQIDESLEFLDRDKALNFILNKTNRTTMEGYYGGGYGYSGFNED